jgi:hypothetical protein
MKKQFYLAVDSGNQKVLKIYRGPGFLAVVSFGSSPTPSPPLPSVNSTGDTGRPRKINNLLAGKGEGVGEDSNHTTP